MPGLIRHDEAVDVFRVRTGPGQDVVNVRGTLARGQTQLRTHGGDDRVLVSSATDLGIGDATPALPGGDMDDLLAALDVEAGAEENLLMVSDRDSGKPHADHPGNGVTC